MSITTKDLARICGVSLGTIDRAFRNRPGIKSETRERIMDVAREYGYKPNILARSLKNRRTRDVGLVVHDLENEFFAQLVNAIQETAWERDYFVQIAVSRRDPSRERTALEHMAGRNVDGIILFPAGSGEGFESFLEGLDRPVVAIANRLSPAWPFVGLKDRSVMRELTAALIARGYRRLCFVGPLKAYAGGINLYEIEERQAGFFEAIEASGSARGLVFPGADYVEALRGLDFSEERTAILCSSDIYALEILSDFRSRGVCVPRDVGLTGFDSIEALRFISPRLTTVEYPIKAMGERAFSLLIEEVASREEEPSVPGGGEAARAVKAARGPARGTPVLELEPCIIWAESV